MNNCPVDVSAIKNTCNQQILKTTNSFENTCYNGGAGLQPGTSPVVSFSRIFSIHFFTYKIRPPVLFSYKIRQQKQLWILFQTFQKNSTETSALKFSVKLLPASMWFLNSSGLKFSPDFQNTEKLSIGVLQKQSCNIN